jgi:hypothetical protein
MEWLPHEESLVKNDTNEEGERRNRDTVIIWIPNR